MMKIKKRVEREKENINKRIYFYFLSSFKRFLLINDKLIKSDKISEDLYKKYVLQLLLSFAQNFEYTTERIEEIATNKFFKEKEEYFKEQFPFLSSIYQFSSIKIKKKAFFKMEKSIQKFIKINKNPLRQGWMIFYFLQSISELYKSENQKNKENLSIYLAKKYYPIIKKLKKKIKNINEYNKIYLKIQNLISSLINQKEVIIEEVKNSKKSYVEDLNKIKNYSNDRLFFEALKNHLIYLKEARPQKNDDLIYEAQTAFIERISNLKEVDNNLVPAIIDCNNSFNRILQSKKIYNVDEIIDYLESIPFNDKNLFLFQLGYFLKNSDSLFKKLNLELCSEKAFFLLGHLYAKVGEIPSFTKIHLNDSLLSSFNKSSKLDIKSIKALYSLSFTSLFYQEVDFNNWSWEVYFNIQKKAAKNLIIHFPTFASLFIFLRALKKQPTLLNGIFNIEEITKESRKSLTKMFSYNFLKEGLWFYKLFIPLLPLDRNLINEYRIAVWNWFKYIAEIYDPKNIRNYNGPERRMIDFFHDSPTPYNLDIVKAYCKFIKSGSKQDLDELNLLLKPLEIKISPDYLKKFGEHLENVINLSSRMLEIFDNVYGAGKIKILLERLHYGNIPIDIEKKLLTLINNITKYKFKSKDEITPRIIGRPDMFQPEEIPLITAIKIFQKLSDTCDFIFKRIQQKKEDGGTLIDLFLINNALESLSFDYIFYLKENCQYLNNVQLIQIILRLLKLLKPFVLPFDENDKIIKSIYYEVKQINELKEACDLKRIVSILSRLERVIIKVTSVYINLFQNNIEKISNLREDIKKDFVADIFRETVVFATTDFVREFIVHSSKRLEIFKNYIVSPGIAIGIPRIIKDPKEIYFKKFKNNEILILPDIDTHAPLPDVAGIITESIHPTLSHTAIVARTKNIPWFVPNTDMLNILKDRIKSHRNHLFLMSSYVNKCSLDLAPRELKLKIKRSKQRNKRLKFELSKKFILEPEEYSIETVGRKAFYLNILNKFCKQKNLKHFSISFSFFNDLIEKNEILKLNIKRLYNYQDKKVSNLFLEKKLSEIRKQILTLKISKEFEKNLKDKIKSFLKIRFPPHLIIRSSTNAEDLPGHPAAGIYESVVVKKEENIIPSLLKVYSSFYTLKAYRDRRDALIDEKTAFPAALFQVYLKPPYSYKKSWGLWSFVIHTSSPVHGKGKMAIEIVPGYGEGLVSGLPEYEGYAHAFVFDKKNRKIKRTLYANKNWLADSSRDVIANYKEDYFSKKETRKILLKVFADAIKLEREANKYDKRKKPRDIEGLIIKKSPKSKKLFIYFVQIREQV